MTRYTPLWEQAGSYAASVDRRLIGALWPAAGVSGCAVTVAAGTMNMNIAAGTVVAPAANNTGSVLCYSDAVEIVTSTAAPAGGTNRYDLVVCQPRGNDLDGGANNDFVFSVVAGVASGSPAVPATPAGAVALAQILVIGGSASLSSGNLVDLRPTLMTVGAQQVAYAQVTANQSGITTMADLTGLSVTFTAAAGRRYRVVGTGIVTSTVVNDLIVGYFRDSVGNQLDRWAQTYQVTTASVGSYCEGTMYVSPPAGPYTIKMSLERNTGTGVVQFQAALTYPAFLSVEVF